LASTSASFLVSDSPIRSNSQLPQLSTTFISPPKQRFEHLLRPIARTQLEANLQQALEWSNGHINDQKGWLRSMQAQNVLQHIYTRKVRGQLEHSKEKRTQKNTRLHVDGRAKLLTHDAFFKQVQDAADCRAQEESDSARRRAAKVTAHERLASALLQWEREREACERQNKEAMERWEKSVTAWEEERSTARLERRKIGWTKP
ncbi:hypothetical protein F5880DRAFT_1443019, partial [Lentinula raphanica]